MMDKSHSLINIGTSGIVLPGNKSSFPEEFQAGTRLQYYSSIFNSLEINSSFYKIPMSKTFRKWTGEVSAHFTFSVKLWRGITHAKNLQFNPDDINLFMTAANQLGSKKGALLIQFPASITMDYLQQVEKILQQLSELQQTPKWHLAVEVRDISWHKSEAYDLFKKYHASLVFHDMPQSRTPLDHSATDIIYLRFHGPSGNYNGSYSEDVIATYAQRIKQWCEADKKIFVYFNNTIGNAYENAISLQQHLSIRNSNLS